MYLMRLKELLVSKICPNLRKYSVRAITSVADVRDVDIRPIETKFSSGRCMTSGTLRPIVPWISWSHIRNIAVPVAENTSMQISVTWPTITPSIPGGRFIWPCAWSWKTVYPIALHPGICGEITAFLPRGPRFKTGSKPREKKAEATITTDYLNQALSDFSGYIAVDELYDGPFCVLSIVDNHRFNRLVYDVLGHSPTHEDITRFFRRFKQILNAKGLKLFGITSDGSPLYPEPIKTVFGDIPHQICEFHVLKEINKTILKAVAQVRKKLKEQQPKLSRGRPASASARKAARRKKRLQNKIADLFEHRYFFVKRSLTPTEIKVLRRITRGLPRLRNLRAIADEVYRLFDRRCRTETALKKLAVLRHRVQRFKDLRRALKKLYTPNIEKALTFLDDSMLPSTSNAVERGYRRHRKMQKSIYRVRTREHISQRIAVDMQRDAQAQGRTQTTKALHSQRGGVLCSR